MSPADILRILIRHWKLLLTVPLVLGGALFYATRHEQKSYASETTIYTGIASGYSLTGNSESDYFRTSNAFDNLLSMIKSRETKEGAACYLLASHLQLKELDPTLLNWASLSRMRTLLPAALRQKLTGPTLAITRRNVVAYASANDTNELYRLLNSHDPVYSVEALGKVNATRLNSSDLVKLELEAEDAAICRASLELTTEVFLAAYRSLRMGQTAAVILYYEAETEKALQSLNQAEDKFLAFNRDNNIINYYEQTKYIAGEREYLNSDVNKIEMQRAASAAALAAVEKKLANRGAALLSSSELLQQRHKLEVLQVEIANRQLFASQREGTAQPVQPLQAQADETVQAIRTTLNDHYAQLNSVAGIPSKGLLDDWVRNMLDVTANDAKLRVMTKRKGEFMEEYHKMAPLGAMLKRIEREIELSQKTYFALLTSLNDSKASQQNNELTTNLKIVAPPFLPSQAKGGKRLVVVAGGAFGGFFFVAATLLGLGLMDKSLRMPAVAQQQTGLPVLGLLAPHHSIKADSSYQQSSIEHLARQVLRKVSANATAAPFVVGVVSPRRQEGKTTLVQALAQRCNAIGLATLALYPAGSIADGESANALCYNPEAAALNRWDLAEITKRQSAPAKLVLIEFPALLEATYPVALLPELQLVLLTLKANRSWQPTDQQALADLRAETTAPVEIVLYGVARYDSTDLIIPVEKRKAA
jgi:succinoglycan biosynthesis transport protein ExoP